MLLAFLPLSGFSHESASIRSSLDIIWVVDNSGSMKPFQKKLSASVGGFLEHLLIESKNEIIINMALVSTDVQDTAKENELVYGITKPKAYYGFTQSQRVSDFKDAIEELGNNGDALSEQAFVPIIMLFNKPLPYNRRFPRKNAKVAIIIISDEDEQGTMLTPELFTNILHYDKKDPDSSVGVYGLLGMAEKGKECGLEQYAGSRYEAVVNATNGKAFPICRSFSYSLSQIAEHLVTRFKL